MVIGYDEIQPEGAGQFRLPGVADAAVHCDDKPRPCLLYLLKGMSIKPVALGNTVRDITADIGAHVLKRQIEE
jgi:hypothetical protein